MSRLSTMSSRVNGFRFFLSVIAAFLWVLSVASVSTYRWADYVYTSNNCGEGSHVSYGLWYRRDYCAGNEDKTKGATDDDNDAIIHLKTIDDDDFVNYEVIETNRGTSLFLCITLFVTAVIQFLLYKGGRGSCTRSAWTRTTTLIQVILGLFLAIAGIAAVVGAASYSLRTKKRQFMDGDSDALGCAAGCALSLVVGTCSIVLGPVFIFSAFRCRPLSHDGGFGSGQSPSAGMREV